MSQIPLDEGTNLIADLFESLKTAHVALFDLGLKVRAIETVLQSHPDFQRDYQAALRKERTGEYSRTLQTSIDWLEQVLSRFRGEQKPVN